MKKMLALSLVFALLFSITACNSTEKNSSNSLTSNDSSNAQKQENTNPNQNKKNVALVMKTLTNPFFISMEKGARKAEAEFGVNLTVKTGAKETSIEQQIAIVEELIALKTDAIVIAPGSSTELIPVLKKAQDAGIKIVNIDNRLDKEFSNKSGLKDVPFISVDNEAGAYLSAKYISEKINTPTEVAVLEGISGADNAEQRKKGALRAFSENKNIKVVASQSANWKIDEAVNVFGKMLDKNSNIKAVFCANDMMALGVLQYLDTNKRTGIRIAGFDALDEAQKAIKDGKMDVTIDQQADVQGYTGVKYVVEMLNGKSVPAETMVDVKIVSK